MLSIREEKSLLSFQVAEKMTAIKAKISGKSTFKGKMKPDTEKMP